MTPLARCTNLLPDRCRGRPSPALARWRRSQPVLNVASARPSPPFLPCCLSRPGSDGLTSSNPPKKCGSTSINVLQPPPPEEMRQPRTQPVTAMSWGGEDIKPFCILLCFFQFGKVFRLLHFSGGVSSSVGNEISCVSVENIPRPFFVFVELIFFFFANNLLIFGVKCSEYSTNDDSGIFVQLDPKCMKSKRFLIHFFCVLFDLFPFLTFPFFAAHDAFSPAVDHAHWTWNHLKVAVLPKRGGFGSAP